jgi:hypothetical protein
VDHSDHDAVENVDGPVDDIEVAVGRRIKAARTESGGQKGSLVLIPIVPRPVRRVLISRTLNVLQPDLVIG